MTEQSGRDVAALAELAKLLGLKKPPRYIEAYDISNIGSDTVVAGMVVFEGGKPLKSAYKRFSIKTVNGIDDYGSMREVIDPVDDGGHKKGFKEVVSCYTGHIGGGHQLRHTDGKGHRTAFYQVHKTIAQRRYGNPEGLWEDNQGENLQAAHANGNACFTLALFYR